MNIIGVNGQRGANNVLGYITDIRTTHNYIGRFGLEGDERFPTGVTIDFSGTAPYSHAIMDVLLNGAGFRSLARQTDAWTCLYCGRPNELHRLDCSSCGGVRNWLIG